jgi:cytoskeletal protein CcmA (bactofilin family)
MFRRNKDNDEKSPAKEDENLTAPPLKPFSKRGTHAPSKPSTPAYRPEVARHVVEIPGSPRRAESNGSGSYGDRKLVVGKEICLNGKITSCDTLVVEGEVEASLTDARLIDVANTGSFRGSATVDEAVINGRFDGDLTARDLLTVRTGGRISGTIRYGRIVIESGGEITGDMQALSAADNTAGAGSKAS